MKKNVTVAFIQPQAIKEGTLEQITNAIQNAGFEIVDKLEHLLTPEEATQVLGILFSLQSN